jgi:hypothetical protein
MFFAFPGGLEKRESFPANGSVRDQWKGLAVARFEP